MATTIKNNSVNVLATTAQVEFEFGSETDNYFPRPFQEVTVRTDPDNTGDIQFAVGEDITAAHEAVGPDEVRIFTIKNGNGKNLFAKASANNQTFTASV